MNSPLISVIIPVYNVAPYLERTIESCIGQTQPDIEIILVDDGSTDASGAIMERYAGQDDRIVVHHQPNRGVTAAREKGRTFAHGRYLFFLDGDDYLDRDALQIMSEAAEHAAADFVIGDFKIAFEDGRSYDRRFFDFKEADSTGALRYAFLHNDFYYTGRLIRRAFYDAIRVEIPSDITFGEDNIAVLQIISQLHKSVKVNYPVLYYVQRSGSVTNRLSRYDLEKRNKACTFLFEYANSHGFYDKIRHEMTVFALREIYSCIVRGYVESEFADKHLSGQFKLPRSYARLFSLKERIVLFSAFLNLRMTTAVIHMLKK